MSPTPPQAAAADQPTGESAIVRGIRSRLSRWPPAPRWALLLLVSAAIWFGLHGAGFPAALLLGPLIAAIALAILGIDLALPRPAFVAAQGLIGCLVAHAITASIVMTVVRDWPAMILVVLVTVLASGLVGAVMTRLGALPGATAAWGSAPGAASAMVAMGEAFGADPRLVAVMQYLRVVCVVLSASLVSRLLLGVDGSPVPPSGYAVADAGWSGGPAWLGVLCTVAIALGGAALGTWSRIPAGGLLVPLAIGAPLHVFGILPMSLPEPLLAFAYAAIGWHVGLRFTPQVLRYALFALPALLAANLALIVLCGLSALALHLVLGTDLLTAFLATTPGGVDSMAIIALGSGADVPLVLAVQTLRLFVVIVTGPPLARLIAKLQ